MKNVKKMSSEEVENHLSDGGTLTASGGNHIAYELPSHQGIYVAIVVSGGNPVVLPAVGETELRMRLEQGGGLEAWFAQEPPESSASSGENSASG